MRAHQLRIAGPIVAVAVLAVSCSSSGSAKTSPGGKSNPPSQTTSAPASSGNGNGNGNGNGGGGYGGATTSAAAAPATVATANNAMLGQILVDTRGHTLYLFLKDRGAKSSCSGDCAKVWPPLTTSGEPKGGTGATASLLGTTTRPDGTKQVTYHGHPLYFYVTDKQRGQTAGEGLDQFGAEWYAISPRGEKVEKRGS